MKFFDETLIKIKIKLIQNEILILQINTKFETLQKAFVLSV